MSSGLINCINWCENLCHLIFFVCYFGKVNDIRSFKAFNFRWMEKMFFLLSWVGFIELGGFLFICCLNDEFALIIFFWLLQICRLRNKSKIFTGRCWDGVNPGIGTGYWMYEVLEICKDFWDTIWDSGWTMQENWTEQISLGKWYGTTLWLLVLVLI